ncbi:Ig-like domain-containing protein [Konateibacter massiliensis]|uniref:Ig-like domain-containing protein n=1 Tax=Konateibacter massiliensis TaxID=2002841 RepID=UPI000C15E8F7|nr:Ig-like domain-containing protein [Konateibacter massiliensis]
MRKERLIKAIALILVVCLSLNTNAFASTYSNDSNVENAIEDIIEQQETVDAEAQEDGMDSGDNSTAESEEESTESAESQEYISSYIEEDYIIPDLQEGYSANTSFAANYLLAIPSSYSSKDSLPEVRNQGSWGVCWSFAAIGAGEASLIAKGITDTSVDLSELQLAYFFYHSVADRLGNTVGDSNNALISNYLNLGGNNVFTTFALAGWVGATDEEKAPYASASVAGVLPDTLAYDDDYHMQNAYWINMASDTGDVKKMIMEYGAVAASYYTDQTTVTAKTACYNPETYAYYYNGVYQTNHAVVIVGWDDNYSSTNFNETKRPASDGAWLVRNSWGTAMGDDGYFWISYEDSAFNSSSSKVFVFDFEEADNYEHNYQYDGASGISSKYVSKGGSLANVFTVSGNTEGNAEIIEAVSFALYDVNVNYTIDIYTSLSDSTDPTSGELAMTQSGSTSYTGYYTIPLDEPVTVKKGKTFSVVITPSKSTGDVRFFVDVSYQNGNWIQFVNTTEAGQSFFKSHSSASWYDLNNEGETARIKAFTTNTDVEEITTGITLSQTSLTLKVGETAALSATVIPENAKDKSVTWTTSDAAVATVDENGKVTVIGAGEATITAATVDGNKATCSVTVMSNVSDVAEETISVTSIMIDTKSLTLNLGDKHTLTAKIYPENATDKSISWTSSKDSVATVDKNGAVTAYGFGTATITAKSKNGMTNSITVTVKAGKADGLAAKSQTTNQIKLSWNTKKSVTGYELYRYDTKKKKYVKIAAIKGADKNSYTDKKLSAATSYQYKIRYYFSLNSGTTYGDYSAVLTTATAPKQTTLSVQTTKKKAKLTWKKVSGASGYEIYMSANKSKGYEKIKTVSKAKTVSYTKTDLKSKKTYYFKVRSYKTVNGVKIYSSYSKVK